MDWFRLTCCLDSEPPREERREHWIWARVVDVYDGDTFTIVMVARGGCFGRVVRRRCRLAGCDAPEMRGPHKAEAMISRDALRVMLPRGAFRMRVSGLDKYGRLLVHPTRWGRLISDELIERGYAVEYDGGTKGSLLKHGKEENGRQ